jgi:hypothetical protein
MAKKTGKVVLRIQMTRPDELLENIEPVTFENDEQLHTYTLMKIGKIRAEGGLSEILGPFKFRFIPIERIVNVECEGIPDAISADTNVNDAIAEAAAARRRDEALRGGPKLVA